MKKPLQFKYPADCGHRNKTFPILEVFALVAFILCSWTERKSIQPSNMTCSGCVMDDMEEKKKKKPTARIYQMRMETAITSSLDAECIPCNLIQPCAFCFPFCFGQNQTPIAQCNVCYLMGERGEGTNSTIWARCSLLGNQLGLGSVPQSLWVKKVDNELFLEYYLCKMPNL